MKNISAFIIAMCLLIAGIAQTPASASDRNVLVEIFTSTTCPPCAPQNQAFMNWLNNYENSHRVSIIKYPVWWPGAGCVFYHANPGPPNNRVSFYNINAAPSGVVDGNVTAGGASGWLNAIQNRMNVESPVTISLDVDFGADDVNVEVTLTHVSGNVPPSNSRLRVAIVEDDIHYTGPNGMPVHSFVHRNMLAGPTGTEVTVPEDGSVSVNLSGDLEADWDHDNLRIVAFLQNDGAGNTVYQSAVYPTITPETAAPELASPANGAEEVDLEVTLEWESVAGAAHYDVQLATDENFQLNMEEFNEVEGTSVTTEMLDQNTTYYWRARALGADENLSEWSDAFSFTTLTVDLDAPELVAPAQGAELTNEEVDFEWTGIDFAQEYVIQIATQPYFTSTDLLLETEHSDTSMMVVLEDERTYYWRVRAQNDLTESEWSSAGSFTLNLTVSTDPDPEMPTEVTLAQNYPNPFNPGTMIRYTLPENTHVQLDVYTVTGQKVTSLVNDMQSAGSHQVFFNAENLSSGTYLYRLQAGETTITRKMLLIK